MIIIILRGKSQFANSEPDLFAPLDNHFPGQEKSKTPVNKDGNTGFIRSMELLGMVAGKLSPDSRLRIRGAFSKRPEQTGGQQSSEDFNGN